MKALVYTNPDEMQFLDQPDPVLADNEVLLKIDAVGICGSDLHAYHGHDPRRKPGLVLGHEFVGTVVQSKSPLYKLNDRITGNPLITCGTCDYCIDGRNNLCSNRTMVGMTRPGAYAEYMSIPAPSLIRLPANMSATKAALTEPAATAVHAINRSLPHLNRPLVDTRVLVLGGGAIGINGLVVLLDRRTQFHSEALTMTQTAANPATRELLENVSRLLGEEGFAEALRSPVALNYLADMLRAQASTLGFQDGFTAIAAIAFFGLIPALALHIVSRRGRQT